MSPGYRYNLFQDKKGRPKGVVISHGALYNDLRYVVDEMKLGPHSRISCYASFSFDISIEGVALKQPEIREAVVKAVDDRLILYYTMNVAYFEADTLVRAMKAELPPYMLPDGCMRREAQRAGRGLTPSLAPIHFTFERNGIGKLT